MFKRLMYDKVIEVLNLNTQKINSLRGVETDLQFEGGYLLGLYPDGIPYVVKQLDPTTKYSFDKVEIIPVSEELSQETPSVNASDRSDYVFRYQVMFRSDNATIVEAALNEFRDYFFTNKQFTLDGYTVAIKTTRGDKQPQVGMDGGHFYNYYQFSVYLTAIKNGYINKDTDIWSIALDTTFGDTTVATSMVEGKAYKIDSVGTTDFTLYGSSSNDLNTRFVATSAGLGNGVVSASYQKLIVLSETFANRGNPIFTNKEKVGKGFITTTTTNGRLQIQFNGTFLEQKLYSWIMNDIDKDTLFKLEHQFNGSTYTYDGYISSGSRTLAPNTSTILDFDWIEADEWV